MMQERPHLKYLMIHNIDTAGANVDPGLLGYHIAEGAALSAAVIARQVEDRGRGLARVDGRLRLIKGLALPSEETELLLSWYNSATYWTDIDQLLTMFGLSTTDRNCELRAIAPPN
jgi:UDP-N-acetylglucosamine pyrophosphorylase